MAKTEKERKVHPLPKVEEVVKDRKKYSHIPVEKAEEVVKRLKFLQTFYSSLQAKDSGEDDRTNYIEFFRDNSMIDYIEVENMDDKFIYRTGNDSFKGKVFIRVNVGKDHADKGYGDIQFIIDANDYFIYCNDSRANLEYSEWTDEDDELVKKGKLNE